MPFRELVCSSSTFTGQIAPAGRIQTCFIKAAAQICALTAAATLLSFANQRDPFDVALPA